MRRVLTSLNEKRIDLRRVFAQLGHRAGGIAGEPAAKDRPIEDLAEHVEDDVGSAIRELPPWTGASTGNVVDLEAIGECDVFQALGRAILG